jgi:hypothetical protein
VFALGRPPVNPDHLVRIPDLEEMPGPGDEGSPAS